MSDGAGGPQEIRGALIPRQVAVIQRPGRGLIAARQRSLRGCWSQGNGGLARGGWGKEGVVEIPSP